MSATVAIFAAVDDYIPKPKGTEKEGSIGVTLSLPRELVRDLDRMAKKLGFKRRSPMVADVLSKWLEARHAAEKKERE